MIHRALAITSLVCCTIVFASFALFTNDQLAGASKHQQNELVSTAPAIGTAPRKHHVVGQPRRFIDGAAKALTSPFDQLVRSDNDWVTHGLPDAVALLVYGLGISFLGRFVRV